MSSKLRAIIREILEDEIRSEPERVIPQNEWTLLAAGDPRRELVKQNLFDLVQQTYEPIGGHFKMTNTDS